MQLELFVFIGPQAILACKNVLRSPSMTDIKLLLIFTMIIPRCDDLQKRELGAKER